MNEEWYFLPKEGFDFGNVTSPNNKWSVGESWKIAKTQYEYFKNYDIMSQKVIINSGNNIAEAIRDVNIGDIMYLQWDKENPHHATIITDKRDDMIFYSAHTRNVANDPLGAFFKNNPEYRAYILRIR